MNISSRLRSARRREGRLWRLLAVLAVVCCEVFVIPPVAAVQRAAPAVRDRRVEIFTLGLPGSVPPEVEADILLQLAVTERIDDKMRHQFVDRVLQLASTVPEPFPRRQLPDSHFDMRSGVLARGYMLGVDAMSLRARAASLRESSRPFTALEILAAVPLDLPPLQCRDSLVYDISLYYRTMAAIVARGRADHPPPRTWERVIEVVRTTISGTRTPAHIAPAALLLIELQQLEEFEELLGVFTAALGSVHADDRTFGAALEANVTAVRKLIEVRRLTAASRTALAQALRAFVVRHLTGTRCTENSEARALRERDALNGLNALASTLTSMGAAAVEPLTANDMRPARLAGSSSDVEFWRTPKSAAILRDYKALRFEGRSPVAEATRRGSEWQQQVVRFLTVLDAWRPADSHDEMTYLDEKAIILAGLHTIVPSSHMREQILAQHVALLRSFDTGRQGRLPWLGHVAWLIRRVDALPADEKIAAKKLLAEPGDPVINAYFAAQEWLAGPLD